MSLKVNFIPFLVDGFNFRDVRTMVKIFNIPTVPALDTPEAAEHWANDFLLKVQKKGDHNLIMLPVLTLDRGEIAPKKPAAPVEVEKPALTKLTPAERKADAELEQQLAKIAKSPKKAAVDYDARVLTTEEARLDNEAQAELDRIAKAAGKRGAHKSKSKSKRK